jgi:predicted DNA-binding transcriptional regulator AlpA
MQRLRGNEVAVRLGVSVTKFYRMVRLGEFPEGQYISSRHVFWDEDVVEAWMSAKRQVQREQVQKIIAAKFGQTTGHE